MRLEHHRTWWQPQNRMGLMDRPRTTAEPTRLPALQEYASPRYPPSRKGPVLREHIYVTRPRPFKYPPLPEGNMTGTFPLSAVSTPGLVERHTLKPPRTPSYDGSIYDKSWKTSVNGFFGQVH